jgi:hypothetical protein
MSDDGQLWLVASDLREKPAITRTSWSLRTAPGPGEARKVTKREPSRVDEGKALLEARAVNAFAYSVSRETWSTLRSNAQRVPTVAPCVLVCHNLNRMLPAVHLF